MEQQLLTAAEVAKKFRITRQHVYGLAMRGLLPHMRIGRVFRFDLQEVEVWAKRNHRDDHFPSRDNRAS